MIGHKVDSSLIGQNPDSGIIGANKRSERRYFFLEKKHGYKRLRVAGTAVLPPSTSVPTVMASASTVQTRAWCFTLNNPVRDEPVPATEDPKQWGASYLVYQLEKGESGTPHYQGYLYFPSNRRLAALRRLAPRAHFEPRRGTHDQARDYCRKDDDRLDGPWEQGEPPAPGKRNDLMLLMADVKTGMSEREIAEKYGATWARNHNAIDKYRRLVTNGRSWKTEVTVLYGPSGTGKSRWAYQQHPDAYPFRGGAYWCGYDCHDHVVVDDFVSGTLPYGVALHVLDRYPLVVDVKLGSKPFVARTIIITSNYPPDTWYPNQRSAPLLRRLDNIVYVDSQGIPAIVKGQFDASTFEGSQSPDQGPPPQRPSGENGSSSSRESPADIARRSHGEGSRIATPWQEAQDYGARSRLLCGPCGYDSPVPPSRPARVNDLEASRLDPPSPGSSSSGPIRVGEPSNPQDGRESSPRERRAGQSSSGEAPSPGRFPRSPSSFVDLTSPEM